MTNEQTENRWEALYRGGLGAPRYPNGHVVRWLFGNFPREHVSDVHLLDMGCGMGRHAVMMASEGFKVSGTDYSAAAIDQAIAWATRAGLDIDYAAAPAEKQPFADQSFDGILSYAVLYYLSLDRMKMSFDEVHRLLKPGGKAFIMVKNHRDVRASKGTEIAPHEFLINQTDDGMPWNNEQDMRLTLLPRTAVLDICGKFSHVMINEMTTTLDDGNYLEAAWLIYLTR